MKKQATDEILALIGHKKLAISLQGYINAYLDGTGDMCALTVAQEITDGLGLQRRYNRSEIRDILLKYKPE